jgi:hypothetical protein
MPDLAAPQPSPPRTACAASATFAPRRATRPVRPTRCRRLATPIRCLSGRRLRADADRQRRRQRLGGGAGCSESPVVGRFRRRRIAGRVAALRRAPCTARCIIAEVARISPRSHSKRARPGIGHSRAGRQAEISAAWSPSPSSRCSSRLYASPARGAVGRRARHALWHHMAADQSPPACRVELCTRHWRNGTMPGRNRTMRQSHSSIRMPGADRTDPCTRGSPAVHDSGGDRAEFVMVTETRVSSVAQFRVRFTQVSARPCASVLNAQVRIAEPIADLGSTGPPSEARRAPRRRSRTRHRNEN